MSASCCKCDHHFYWSNNAWQWSAAFYCFRMYFWYIECYIFTVTLNCSKMLSTSMWGGACPRAQGLCVGRAQHSSGHIPVGHWAGSALPCTRCTLFLQLFRISSILASFPCCSWIPDSCVMWNCMVLMFFPFLAVLTWVLLNWQVNERDLCPLTYYPGLRGNLLSLNNT